MDLGPDRAVVHVDDTGEDVVDGPHRRVHIPREDRGGQAVLYAVQDADRVVEVLRLDDVGDRPEDLLLLDPHAGGDVVEDGRGVEMSPREGSIRDTAAAHQHARAFPLPDLDVAMDAL